MPQARPMGKRGTNGAPQARPGQIHGKVANRSVVVPDTGETKPNTSCLLPLCYENYENLKFQVIVWFANIFVKKVGIYTKLKNLLKNF